MVGAMPNTTIKRPVLQMRLYGTDVLRLVTGGGRFTPPERIDAHAPLVEVSAGWKDTIPDGRQIELWLSALLPQGGARSLHWRIARETFDREGVHREASDSADAIWGQPGREYAGAITFESHGTREDGSALEAPPVSDERLATDDIKREIGRAIVQMRTGDADSGDSSIALPVSSGVLPKIGLHLDQRTGAWHRAAPDDRPSTHIWKHEDRGHLPAEAAVEAVCLRALGTLGIRTAPTRAIMAGDFQMVVSERSDRRWHAKHGRIERIHQEEWVQAAGLDPAKLSQQPGEGGGWRELHAMLSAGASNPEAERAHLWATLAACVMLGHRDLHRRNLGILHAPAGEDRHIELAPLYDVSSMEGQADGYTRALPIPVGGARAIDEIGEAEWVTLATECDQTPDGVLAAVRGIAQNIDDALAQAIESATHEDEWRNRGEAQRRLKQVQEGVAERSAKARIHTRGQKQSQTGLQARLQAAVLRAATTTDASAPRDPGASGKAANEAVTRAETAKGRKNETPNQSSNISRR